MSKTRVVITGMGIVSPVGNRVDTAWEAVRSGRSGIRNIDKYDVSAYTTQFAGLVADDFKADEWMAPKEVRKTDPFIHYGVAAAKQAVKDAGLTIDDSNRDRIGVCVGSGIGGIGTIEKECAVLREKGPRRMSPFFVPSSIINMVTGHISIDLGIVGPSLAAVSACTTGAHAIGLGLRLIQAGDADAFIVGGAECGSSPAGLAGFCQARALSTRNDAPTEASRPWDKARDGFVLGDGAGVLVIERLEDAQARGATIYAELCGLGMSSDAYHITLPPETGEGAQRAMQNALKDAGVDPSEIGYINAHGTSTHAGDIAETAAVHGAFGDHAQSVAVSSTKSMTGHLLGAAGGIEAIFTALALHDGVLPPTINFHEAGEGCDLDYVPNKAREQQVEYALSNSFGFGGTNATIVFKRFA